MEASSCVKTVLGTFPHDDDEDNNNDSVPMTSENTRVIKDSLRSGLGFSVLYYLSLMCITTHYPVSSPGNQIIELL